MNKPLSLHKLLATLLTIVAVFAGQQAWAESRTVTYTFTVEQVSGYQNRVKLTFTPSSLGFNHSTGQKTVTIPDITSTTGFTVELDDGLQLTYSQNRGHLSYGPNALYLNYTGDGGNSSLNLGSNHYYVTHVKLANTSGNALQGQAIPWTGTNALMDVDVDMVTMSDDLGVYRTFNATFTSMQVFGQFTVTYGDPREYDITYTNAVNGQNGVTNNNVTTYNVTTNTFQITAPTRTGYDFDGFTYTDAQHSNPTTASLPMTIERGDAAVRKAITFNASWTAITYNITYNLAGGSVATANPTTYNIETATFTLNNPTRTGYTFAGWTGTDLSEPTMNVTIAQGSIGDRSYTATWNTITYNISYDLAGGSVATANPTTYNIETATFTLNNPTRTGYTFAGWTGTDLDEPTINVTIAQGSIGDRSYTATWNTITYNISYNLAGGSVATANPTTYNIETATFTLNNPTREGYTFAGWTGTDLSEPTMNVTIAQGSIGDRSYTATWNTITYNISYNLAGGSVATANPTTYNIETATFTLNNPTRTGYTFAGWTGTGLNGPTMNVTIAQGSIGDRSYTATWNTITYNISYDLAGGSVATANPTTYNIETATFTLNNPTREGYTFAGWTGTGLNGPTMNVTIAQGSIGDRSYTATWNTITYNLTYDLAGGSVATANPTTYNIETATFTLNNPTREGYTFAGWTGTGLNGPTMNVTIAQGSIGDRSYTATWNTNTYNISYDLAGGNVATANPTTYNIETATFTLNNPTRTGYTFAGWTGTDLDKPTINVTIAQGSIGDRSYTATWNTITYNLTYDLAGGSVATANPTTYNIEMATFTLNNPTREGYTFAGWTGTDLNEPTMNVTIAQGSIGDRSYTATWSLATYSITYNLAGGSVATANPTTYNIETATFTLNNPTRQGCTFAGWTGTDLDEPTITVTIAQGSTGDRSYTATWSLLPVTYIDADGVEQTLYDYTLLEGSDEYIAYGEYWVEAWYVVAHDVTYNEGFAFLGNAKLILVDGATLTVTSASGNYPNMERGTALTIYAQSGGTGAIVGENIQISSYNWMVIYGGNITLSGHYYGLYSDHDITINGGQISIEAEGGCIYAENDLTINGGEVSATMTGNGNAIDSYHVVINGGVVTTTNQQEGGLGIYGYNDVTINGGVVTANAAADGYGIRAGFYEPGIITLGWTNETDRITASSYYGKVTIATGQAFVDNAGNYYQNNLNDSQMAAISGQTLSPFTDFDMPFAITYETDGGTLPEGYPETYTYAETVSLPIPTKEDNTFWAWYDNAAFEGDPVTEITAGTSVGNKTFYAYWLPKYTDVTYLDADGQPQTVRATILYPTFNDDEIVTSVYEGGVYTLWDEYYSAYFDLLRFTGDATLILPDGGSLVVAWGKGATDFDELGLFVDGNLTIYGQEKGNAFFSSSLCQVDGNVNIYGGKVSINYLLLNADSDINLSWTGLGNYIDIYDINPTQCNVNLLKDFISYSWNEEEEHPVTTIFHAGQPVGIADLCGSSFNPYVETIDVSYIDENGDEHVAHDAQVLWGNETSLPGGTYTIISYLGLDHEVTFNGNTTIIVPDDMYITLDNPDGSNITVNGDLAIYGQEERSGYLGFSGEGIQATGNVTVSNVSSYYSKIFSGGDILVAGGEHYFEYLKANDGNGTITLGYLTEEDQVGNNNYEGTVVIREGQTMQDRWSDLPYSGTLTPEQVTEIEGHTLIPYLTPITLTVEGYGESDGGWVLIASPLAADIAPTDVTNMTNETFDLYYFDQTGGTNGKEWKNWKNEGGDGYHFNLESGKGYLYATKDDVTLAFRGAVYPAASKEVALDYDANAEFAGWNLVGNPFNAPATLDKSYYSMNSAGTGIVAEAVSASAPIAAFTGVMVQATDTDQTVTFTKSGNAKGQQETDFGTLQIALTQAGNRGTALLDNAIVSFNEGDQLGKFYFGTQDANIYIPQGSEEYAIVSVGNAGEMPLNFRAEENGNYTITVHPDNVELAYLHLIDNMTGADVDLLISPSYIFTANTTDYESRFKLVFSAIENADDDDDAPFAFVNNGNIIINVADARSASLQIVDMMGRVIRDCTDVARNVSTQGMAPGVYVLRLIDGDTIRTQKIVVK